MSNKTEVEALVNHPVATKEDAILAAELLRERGVKRVALTMGGDGVSVLDESGATHMTPPRWPFHWLTD